MGRQKTVYKFDNVPMSWNEITLEKYVEIHKAYVEDEKPNMMKILAIILNSDEETINNAPTAVITNIISRLKFLNDKIDDEPLQEVTIDNETYRINSEEELKFKEYVDFQTVLESDKYAYPQMLAILCRKKDEQYDDDFIATKLQERIEIFKKAKITDVIHLITFFLFCNLTSQNTTEQFINQLKEEGNLILTNYESSLKNGAGQKSFLKSQMKKLQTLRKQLNSI